MKPLSSLDAYEVDDLRKTPRVGDQALVFARYEKALQSYEKAVRETRSTRSELERRERDEERASSDLRAARAELLLAIGAQDAEFIP